MSFKILFNGFRHGHIHGLYQKVTSSAIAEIAGCIEPNDEARAAAESTLGAVFSTKSYDEWLASDIDAVAIGNAYGERGQKVNLTGNLLIINEGNSLQSLPHCFSVYPLTNFS